MKWISVEDGLPDHGVEVLVFANDFNPDNDINSSWMDVLEAYICPEYGDFQWLASDGEDFPSSVNCKVTHWMPLPEPPESNKNKQS